MHPIQMLISGVTGAPTPGHERREEEVAAGQATAQNATEAQSLLNAVPKQQPPAAPATQAPIGSSGAGTPSYLASAATAPTQQNTASKTLLGQ